VSETDPTVERVLAPGTRVEVCDAFEGDWHRGYVVEGADEVGYRVRRSSDDTALPRVLPPDSVRREHRSSMWWI